MVNICDTCTNMYRSQSVKSGLRRLSRRCGPASLHEIKTWHFDRRVNTGKPAPVRPKLSSLSGVLYRNHGSPFPITVWSRFCRTFLYRICLDTQDRSTYLIPRRPSSLLRFALPRFRSLVTSSLSVPLVRLQSIFSTSPLFSPGKHPVSFQLPQSNQSPACIPLQCLTPKRELIVSTTNSLTLYN